MILRKSLFLFLPFIALFFSEISFSETKIATEIFGSPPLISRVVVSPSGNKLFVLLSNLTSLTESKTCGGNNSICVAVADVASVTISTGCEIIGAVVSIIPVSYTHLTLPTICSV